ncbi:TetR family transcriptional regulator [Amycolatopsis sp. CA-230715]|uniref:TetR family transcriptional regulator n=1 Tax=Amycolatopsis sp. CA-230715 TaxID=2745196 RepID=UPI001C019F3D|nr:TetR family transcriptional regulator [Amycolatopsis sp. CA-230715]QWF81507.1 HTH-type transcriptional repressor [Amycolatopsis sp. CA-230715]
MARDAQATRRKLLEAATAEFSAYGIAGARVDRIAAGAGCNKAMIYSYFGNKDQLFDAVFDAIVTGTVTEVPIDAADLPRYAGKLFDRYHAHPEALRLATWYALERGGREEPPAMLAKSTAHKVAAIREAQNDGTLPTRFDAEDLLTLVIHLSTTGSFELSAPKRDDALLARRRASIVAAVACLIAG